uniref:Uncharacterized protein n=1 Tax=Trichogramma kaykai TaxID=54128 RepID=A0ABD2WST5_9HYME
MHRSRRQESPEFNSQLLTLSNILCTFKRTRERSAAHAIPYRRDSQTETSVELGLATGCRRASRARLRAIKYVALPPRLLLSAAI